jgi:hypothetical protein
MQPKRIPRRIVTRWSLLRLARTLETQEGISICRRFFMVPGGLRGLEEHAPRLPGGIAGCIRFARITGLHYTESGNEQAENVPRGVAETCVNAYAPRGTYVNEKIPPVCINLARSQQRSHFPGRTTARFRSLRSIRRIARSETSRLPPPSA